MKPPVSPFKRKGKKLCLFLKAKSQNLINTVVATFKTWTRTLDPDPGPWTRTLNPENLTLGSYVLRRPYAM